MQALTIDAPPMLADREFFKVTPAGLMPWR
jgi:hypothetical protein